ncbi:MAG TPA: HAD family hydrolase [Bryobacteraceae bacterium]|nr:HAD family hydrolase [Bryobacteraceae bacterium]
MSRACVFLDRDGVINMKPPPGGYLRDATEFRLAPNVADWIRLFRALGFLVIVVTNQRGVARGITRPADLEEIHRRMRAELERAGARIDDIFVCPHEEGACDCRKPRPGLVEQAREKWDIDLRRSVMIGDSDVDRQLAANCGLRFIRVDEGRILETPADEIQQP